MKNLSLLVLALFPVLALSQTQTENYIKNTTYKVETQDGITNANTNLALTDSEKQQSITYFDGLGRPVQKIAHKQSGPSGAEKDIVTPITYDVMGRQVKDYLPYVPATAASLNYKSNALADVLTYYDDTKYDADFPGMTTGTTNTINPYSQKELETSPLNRVLKQAAPGYDWKLGNGHEIRFEYQTNSTEDQVRHFRVSFTGGNTEAPNLVDNGVYNLNELYKTIIKDENWQSTQTNPSDHTTQEFKDRQGHLILKRTFDTGKWHDTYYVYDDYGNLTYVLPPQFFTYNSITQAYISQSTFRDTDAPISFFASGGGNAYADFTMSQNQENNITLNLFSDGFTPGAILKAGKISDLDFTPDLPNMPLGNIMVTDVGGNTVVGGTAYIQNGDLYFTSNGTGIYNKNTDNYPELSITLTSPGLTNYQSQYTPPALNMTSSTDLIYEYHYDKRNRLIEKKLPGKDWEYIIYDKLDRPAMTQDANLRKTSNLWLFTKYDALGRVAYTGIYPNGDAAKNPRAAMQNYFDSQNNTSNKMYESRVPLAVSGGYSNSSYTSNNFPKTSLTINTINYYDNYDFYSFNKDGVTLPATTSLGKNIVNYNDAGATQLLTKGLLTGTRIRVSDNSSTNYWATSAIGYDEKGRAIYTVKCNKYLSTLDIVESQLDFVGKVDKTITRHSKGNTNITIVDIFTYDQAGRLTKQTQAINGAATPEIIVANTYDDLGQLISKKVGGKTTQGLQTVDYDYNIRGWLKNINNPNNLGTDLFGFALNYNVLDGPASTSYSWYSSSPLYNGNISSTYWKTANINSNIKQYNYQYDAMNRFKNAYYAENTVFNNYFMETITDYDRNGNIMGLVRYQPSGQANYSSLMDYLTYTYKNNGNSNTLLKVSDVYSATEGFNDGYRGTADDYTYDNNGNLTVDRNKGITNITYNHLNLPVKITFATGIIEYMYDATGAKQRKKVSSGSGTTTTDYAGGFQYENNVLKFFPHPEGYVDCTNGTFSYIYQYKDHLGNVRLSYKNVGTVTSPSLQIVAENSYYPFGMKHKDNVNAVNSTNVALKLLYNGKELQDELGLNFYDYGWRNYDSALGRWMNIDPKGELLEASSPYVYALNCPIIYLDKDGELPIFINGRVTSDDERANEKYWTTEIINTIKGSGIPNPGGQLHYVDGDRYYSYNLNTGTGGMQNGSYLAGHTPSERRAAGYTAMSKAEFKTILSKLARNSDGKIIEKIQIYTHSRGAAFGEGYTQHLLELIKENASQFLDADNEVDFVFNMAPHQSDFVNTPEGVDSYSMDHNRDKLSDNDMGGVKGAFSSGEKASGFFGAHSISSFNKDLKAFTSAFLKGGTSKNVTNNFIKTMKEKYGVTVTVKQ